MNWWQTLIVAVVPVLVTLIITNVAESKRRKQDAAQREQDWAAERNAHADARRASIEDHWRNERLTRMTALVDVVSDLTRLAIDAKTTVTWADGEHQDLLAPLATETRGAVLMFSKRKESDLPQAVTQVAVIASQRFYVHSMAMLDEIRQGFKPVLTTTVNNLRTAQDFATASPTLVDFADDMALINTRLINLVREELTGDSDSFIRNSSQALEQLP
ncbi:hypothetical protein [Nocardioides sp. 616]|uniref:hypothetical protein n=1 Tax=Nocardioides sp. 616 TaxID=2268090 RepID=UPI000CE42B85|nr:hypothetical protein [Nocardioides sp. 616]